LAALTDFEKEQILQKFDNGMNCAQIARDIGRSKDGVWSFLNRSGRDTRRSVYRHLSRQDILEICESYLAGATTVEILSHYPSLKCDRSIAKILKENDIKIRPRGKQTHIKHEDFFAAIDSEQKAYVLGLLMADGYIIYPRAKTHKNPFWGISLHQKDEYLLTTIKHLIGSEKSILREREESILTIVSARMVKDLERYGVVPRKSEILRFPYNVPHSLWRHVIRGVFDGDGCVSGKICSFYGNETFLIQLREILFEEIDIPKNKITCRPKGKGAASFSFSSKNDVNRFFHFLYDDASIYLVRKKEKFIKNHGLTDNQC